MPGRPHPIWRLLSAPLPPIGENGDQEKASQQEEPGGMKLREGEERRTLGERGQEGEGEAEGAPEDPEARRKDSGPEPAKQTAAREEKESERGRCTQEGRRGKLEASGSSHGHGARRDGHE